MNSMTGGLGFMTFATLLFRLMGRSLTLRSRMIVQDAMNEDMLGGMVRLVQWVILSTFCVEFTGAVLLSSDELMTELGGGENG